MDAPALPGGYTLYDPSASPAGTVPPLPDGYTLIAPAGTAVPSAKPSAAAKPVSALPSASDVTTDPDKSWGFGDTLGGSFTFGADRQAKAIAAGLVRPLFENVSTGDAYRNSLTDQDASKKTWEATNPLAAGAAKVIGLGGGGAPGVVRAGALPTLGEGTLADLASYAAKPASNLLGRVWQGAKGGAAIGGVSGGGEADWTNPGAATGSAALAAALGGAGGSALPVVARGVGAVLNPIAQRAGLAMSLLKPDSVAAQRVGRALGRSGTSVQDVSDSIGAAPGMPLTIADVGGEDAGRLLGSTYRAGGPGRQYIAETLTDRDLSAPSRMMGAVDQNVAGGSSYLTEKALVDQAKTNAAPLYDRTFAGGSMAPLQHQFEGQFNAASSAASNADQVVRQAQQALTIAQSKVPTASDIYTSQAATEGVRTAQSQLNQAETLAQHASSQRDEVLSRLQKAQADGTANAPGAVWNPRIQQFLDDPIMKQGINHGLEIQRIESVTNGTPFNPSEYAIVGQAQNGDPIVGAVPNMRLLDAGKRGLDAMLDSPQAWNDTTGEMSQWGRTVNGFRKAYLQQLDSVNPDYAAARAAWSGPLQSKMAIRAGEQSMTPGARPEAIADALDQLDPGNKQFYLLGAANKLRTDIGGTSNGGNEALKLIGNDNLRQRLQALGVGGADINNLVQNAWTENKMFQTKLNTMGNSMTADRSASDAAINGDNPTLANATVNAGMAAASLHHEPFMSAGFLGNSLKSLYGWAAKPSDAVNEATARMLLATDPTAQSRALAAVTSGYVPGDFTGKYIAPVTNALGLTLRAPRVVGAASDLQN